jgi:hypothetical protein
VTTIRFPAALHALPQGLTFVADYASAAGFSPARVAEIAMAVGKGEVQVQCTHDTGPCLLYIDIVDSGVPFDPLSVPLPDLREDPAERASGEG